MRIYSVTNDQGYCEEFYSLPAAKKAMKEHNAIGSQSPLLLTTVMKPLALCSFIAFLAAGRT